MNIVFSLILISSIVMTMVNSPSLLVGAMQNGAKHGIELLVTLCAIYAIWMSVLRIIEDTGVDKTIHRALYPVTHRLFPHEDEKTLGLIASNFSLNLLGMGGAATPLGIKAVEHMQGDRHIATPNSILFAVINATSIQLVPMTIIGMRATHGAGEPADIILPTLLSTTVATAVGVVLCKVLARHD